MKNRERRVDSIYSLQKGMLVFNAAFPDNHRCRYRQLRITRVNRNHYTVWARFTHPWLDREWGSVVLDVSSLRLPAETPFGVKR